MRIVFLGPPGAGKGTQAKRVCQELGVAHLSTGEMLRKERERRTELGLLVADYLDNGQLVPDQMVLDIVADRIEMDDCKPGCIFDGFPRTLHQAEAFDRLLDSRNTPLDVVVELVIEQGELLQRLMKRGRGDDNMATIRQRLRSYENQTEPLVNYYSNRKILRSVDASGSMEDVFQSLLAAIASVQ
ncbi:adenylate kinase [Aeoliella mucimassa]|uniref:Adenylate kinase n=1 Tax=Aeoliella mucimassa TaxID=2527972 RepID=A0A518AU45_9BACT|nr:adenylate kinase [Aeoliella mucimassa]QDU58250.1 Adenylate kinase [Aeoliella mucimassa]